MAAATGPESGTETKPDGAVATSGSATSGIDGRRARGERNREAVVSAILELLAEGVERPGTLQIAERSGVSVRSVFRHFDDVESLYAAAIERHVERVRPLYAPIRAEGPLHARARALAQQRSRLFEAMTPVRRVAERLRSRSSVINANLDRSRRILRRQVGELFAAELAELESSARREVLDALEMATSWSAWNGLRTEQGCSIARAERVFVLTVVALVES